MKYIFSSKVALILLLVAGIAMGRATFIENDFGTAVARSLVYEAWWFEFILVWLGFCFIAHINKYKLFSAAKWPIGLLHIAFLIILLGAGVTRYFGKEGLVHIRKGDTAQHFLSSEAYAQVINPAKQGVQLYYQPVSLIAQQFKPSSLMLNEALPFTIHIDTLVDRGVQQFERGEDTYFEIATVSGNQEREDAIYKLGEVVSLKSGNIVFEKDTTATIAIFKTDSSWYIYSKIPIESMSMATQEMSRIAAHQTVPLQTRTLYQLGEGALVIKAIHEKASIHWRSQVNTKEYRNLPAMLQWSALDKSGKRIGQWSDPVIAGTVNWHSILVNQTTFKVAIGAKMEPLPFQLALKEFELKRYPGSQSPESYASEMQVIDGAKQFPYRIFMNNVLDYNGYRFFQTSYDTDEQGTILSVNKDWWGTRITYIGYLLLALGMLAAFFVKGGRFAILNSKLKLKSTTVLSAFLLLLASSVVAQSTPSPQNQPVPVIPTAIARSYGELVVQDLDGRMKPLNTLAHEITRKLYGKSTVEIKTNANTQLLNPEQFLLAIQLSPELFRTLPVLKADIKKAGDAIQAAGLPKNDRLAFDELISKEGNYLLAATVEQVNRLKPAERTDADQEILKLDERFNIYFGLLTGDFLRLYPKMNDHNHTWYTGATAEAKFNEEDGRFVQMIMPFVLQGLSKGLATGNYQEGKDALQYLSVYQQKAGATVYPGKTAIDWEIRYNEWKLTAYLFPLFWMMGVALLLLVIIQMFKQTKWLLFSWHLGTGLMWLGWMVFTCQLGLRWYIAKHPPWSDGFEMLVFVSWGTLLSGLLLAKKSKFALPMATLFSGTLLFVSFLDWLNPEITNLMPVLHSYWLKIHVAVIVGSYAPLALSALMALMAFLLLSFAPKSPNENWVSAMRELTIVNEMAQLIGLFLLTIGTFLGGVWANESWGRYWAWDPKETWALISILVYAVVLHLRLVPQLRNFWIFQTASYWAFSSIIMTSFGVNYYLSGLHSYAKGDPVPLPNWVYVAFVISVLLSVISKLRYNRLPSTTQQQLSL